MLVASADMDAETVDREYATLEQQAQQTAGLIQALATKLSAASTAGDANAREWALDLKEIALAVREEEGSATSLLQAIHSLVDNHVQQQAAPVPQAPSAAPQPQYVPQQPVYQQPAYQPQYQQPMYGQQQSGGMLQRFLGGGFGRAIVTGAGFGIGDDIVNDIFNQF